MIYLQVGGLAKATGDWLTDKGEFKMKSPLPFFCV